MKFSIKVFPSKCDQIHIKLRIWSHLMEKVLMENFIFCAVRELCEPNNKFQDDLKDPNTQLFS